MPQFSGHVYTKNIGRKLTMYYRMDLIEGLSVKNIQCNVMYQATIMVTL